VLNIAVRNTSSANMDQLMKFALALMCVVMATNLGTLNVVLCTLQYVYRYYDNILRPEFLAFIIITGKAVNPTPVNEKLPNIMMHSCLKHKSDKTTLLKKRINRKCGFICLYQV